MPELPEVETIARQLQAVVRGAVLDKVEILDDKLSCAPSGGLSGRVVEEVKRIGKHLVFYLGGSRRSEEPLLLIFHLRMTGNLLWRPKRRSSRSKSGAALMARRSAGAANPEKYTRAVLSFKKGEIWFVDPRRFGTICTAAAPERIGKGGADPLGPDMNCAALRSLLQGSRQAIKPWLLRQDRLAGIGNIYASEILFSSGIDPRRGGGELSRKEVNELCRSMKRILEHAVRACGTTFADFRDAAGEGGGYSKFLKVYNREGEPCRSCGRPIARIVQQSRSTFFCPSCQM